MVDSHKGELRQMFACEGLGMPYPATAIANEFLTIAKAERKDLSPMKLQKLVFFAHGWCLALTGKPLISDRVEAWQYGPVIPSLYHEFKYSGNGAITVPATTIGFDRGKMCFETISLDDYPDDEERRDAKQIIARVFDVYKDYSAVQLSNATHMQGTPWQQVYREGVRNLTIPDETIKSYFQGIANVPGR